MPLQAGPMDGVATSLSDRHLSVLDCLQKRGFASVQDLRDHLGVSLATVRRDLAALERHGKIQRTHGGALLTDPPGWALPNPVRAAIHREEKRAIARSIAEMIQENERVLIDAGTTTLEVAKLLARRPDLSFVTNGLEAANVLASAQNSRFVLLGGDFREHNQSFCGPMARECLDRFRVDTAVLSTSGIDLERGAITMPDLDTASVQQAMIRSARRNIVAADHTKLTSAAFISVAPIDAIDVIVTGTEAAPDLLARLSAHDVTVVSAGSPS